MTSTRRGLRRTGERGLSGWPPGMAN